MLDIALPSALIIFGNTLMPKTPATKAENRSKKARIPIIRKKKHTIKIMILCVRFLSLSSLSASCFAKSKVRFMT